MTARPLRLPRSGAGLRVIPGRKAGRHPLVAPWLAFALVVVVAFLGMVIARTTLDRGAFDLAGIEARIESAEVRNRHLLLEVARLESPARVGPLAEEMGLVYPDERLPLLVEGVTDPEPAADPRWAAIDHYAGEAATPEGDRP